MEAEKRDDQKNWCDAETRGGQESGCVAEAEMRDDQESGGCDAEAKRRKVISF